MGLVTLSATRDQCRVSTLRLVAHRGALQTHATTTAWQTCTLHSRIYNLVMQDMQQLQHRFYTVTLPAAAGQISTD